MDTADLRNRFLHHPPKGDQANRYSEVRARALNFAEWLNYKIEDSRELSLAITHLEEVVFWSNAAIARNEKWSDSEDQIKTGLPEGFDIGMMQGD